MDLGTILAPVACAAIPVAVASGHPAPAIPFESACSLSIRRGCLGLQGCLGPQGLQAPGFPCAPLPQLASPVPREVQF